MLQVELYYFKIFYFSDPNRRPTLHKLMIKCFQFDPNLRPNFNEISSLLTEDLQPNELDSLK